MRALKYGLILLLFLFLAIGPVAAAFCPLQAIHPCCQTKYHQNEVCPFMSQGQSALSIQFEPFEINICHHEHFFQADGPIDYCPGFNMAVLSPRPPHSYLYSIFINPAIAPPLA